MPKKSMGDLLVYRKLLRRALAWIDANIYVRELYITVQLSILDICGVLATPLLHDVISYP